MRSNLDCSQMWISIEFELSIVSSSCITKLNLTNHNKPHFFVSMLKFSLNIHVFHKVYPIIECLLYFKEWPFGKFVKNCYSDDDNRLKNQLPWHLQVFFQIKIVFVFICNRDLSIWFYVLTYHKNADKILHCQYQNYHFDCR